ncbi:zinc metalloprotease HtpX [Aciditerrimonas ferrireducens]|jgi:heat shock protein HtpX|uniref:Protease HtpX homolog n=1 Tax=Aciditerrimonas ferrireducens TaxID=667306 RepID=A0ABV6C4S8_9ACTN|nr:zinc metalloprotease HtpX [Aciditerrimonas ferrireducens]MCK4177929.1 zinc metalloprotease HtpX [Aciditerrimonas ferrireducens]
MATTSRIPADHGLTVRMFITGLLLVVLYAVVGGILYALGVGMAIVVAIPLALAVCQYWFSDKIALWGMKGHIVTPEEEPELHGIVDRLCALADMPKPRVAVAEVDMPNAFATGRNPKNAVVCATRGILRRLDEPELEAVLSHELSHVAHRDVAVMTIASFLGMVAGMITRMMFWMGLFGGFGGGYGRDRRNAENLAIMELAVLLFSVIVYAISFLLTMALSRYRELAADRSGAILIGRPALLASALVKVSGEMGRIPTRDLRQAEHFNAFFFTPALTKGTSVSTLFSTHPPLEKRLEQLAKLERQLNQA